MTRLTLASLCILLTVCCIGHAHATQVAYQLEAITEGEDGPRVISIDSSGDTLFVSSSALCDASQNHGCYQEIFRGSQTFTPFSATPPSFIPDTGSPCAADLIPVAFNADAGSACNNGYEVVSGRYIGDGTDVLETAVFYGTFDPKTALIIPRELGTSNHIFLNESGDFAFAGAGAGEEDENEIGLNVTPTPEPGSIALLGTGFLSAVGLLRKRLC